MSADTAELRESARKVLRGPGVAADEERGWQQIVALGWLSVTVPEELGGLGLGLSGACALYRELGVSLATIPLLPAMLVVEALSRAETRDHEIWAERLAAGDYACAPLADGSLVATFQGARAAARLTGLVSAVPSADKANLLVVWTSNEACVAVVPLGRPGIELVRRPTWDRTRRLFDVSLDDVALEDGLVLARGAAAAELILRLSTHRDFALAADSVGGAGALLDMTVDYLLTRRQFGRPLAMFQALKHRCADLKVLVAAAEALLADALGRLGDAGGGTDAALLGKQSKSFASSVYSRVAEEALQLHGGIGMTSEHGCHLFLKRALLNAHLGRSNESCDLDVAAGTLCGL